MTLAIGDVYLLGEKPLRRADAFGLVVQVRTRINDGENRYVFTVLNREECPRWESDVIRAAIDLVYDKPIENANCLFKLDASL